MPYFVGQHRPPDIGTEQNLLGFDPALGGDNGRDMTWRVSNSMSITGISP